MATQGPFFPGTVTTVQEAGDDDNWVNPGNVSADDAAEAQVTAATFDTNDQTFFLKAQNFGFTIPSDATIDGITVEIERRDFAGNARDLDVVLLNATGVRVGDDKALTATDWPGTPTIQSYGGAADTWNATPTPAMVNDVDFGVGLKALATAANTDIGVDFIRVTVTYTPAAQGALLEGSIGMTATLIGALTTAITMAGSILAQAAVAAVLTTQITLGGAVAGQMAPAAALTTEIQVAGAVAGQLTPSGDLTTSQQALLEGQITGALQGAGELTTEIRLAGTAAGTAALTGSLEEAGSPGQGSLRKIITILG